MYFRQPLRFFLKATTGMKHSTFSLWCSKKPDSQFRESGLVPIVLLMHSLHVPIEVNYPTTENRLARFLRHKALARPQTVLLRFVGSKFLPCTRRARM